MKVKLHDFKRKEFPPSPSGGNVIWDSLDLTVFARDGKSYRVVETFHVPGFKLRNIKITDNSFDERDFDETIVNLNDVVIANKKRTDPSVLKNVVTRLLNSRNEIVRDDAETYYNHITAILKFLEDFHEGKRQAMLMNLDDETAETWQDVIGKL